MLHGNDTFSKIIARMVKMNNYDIKVSSEKLHSENAAVNIKHLLVQYLFLIPNKSILV